MSGVRLSASLLILASYAPAAAQRATIPPAAVVEGPSVGSVSLGMDVFGRERLCNRLPEVFADAARSIDDPVPVQAVCRGGPKNELVLTSHGFATPQRSVEVVCDLLHTPLALVAPQLHILWIRRSEPPKAGVDVARSLESLGVRDLGGFLEASGFARIAWRRPGNDAPLAATPIYQLNRQCS